MDQEHKTAWSRGPFRVECRCDLEFTGPLHVGSGEALSLATDAPVLRDGDGRVWLPGSSVRGVLADWCRREAPLVGVEPAFVRRLFGVTPGRGDGSSTRDRQGRLTVLDGELGQGTEQIRDHVRIDRRWGAAATGAKFDQEIASPRGGTLRLLYEGDGPEDPELALLRSAVDALEEGLLAFGGKTGWGLGTVRTDNPAWSSFKRNDVAGLSAYVNSRLPRTDRRQDGPAATSDQAAAWPQALDNVADLSNCKARKPEPNEPRPWSWLRLHLSLAFDGPMLVAALDTTSPVADSPFSKERREAHAAYQVGPDGQDGQIGQPVLAGSALRGPLRSDAERIQETLGLHLLAETLFGTTQAQGLIRVGEGKLLGDAKPVLLNHVSIDRVTGFAADKRLFNVAALASPCFSSELLVRWNAAAERQRQAIALLLFVLRDGEQQGLWIGSRTTRGYGHAKHVAIASAKWSLIDGAAQIPQRQAADRCGKINVADLAGRLKFVDEAWKAAFPHDARGQEATGNAAAG